LNSTLQVVLVSLEESTLLIGGFLIFGLILGFLERKANRNMWQALGKSGVILTAFIGTPVHEAGHALLALLFGHKIVEIKLLQLGSPDGVLGYVSHSYNKRNLYQRIGNFFIALGPLFSGTFTILASMYFLLPKTFHIILNKVAGAKYINFSAKKFTQYVAANFQTVFLSMFTPSNFRRAEFWVFLFIAVCIASHIALSTQDMKGMRDGLVAAYLAAFLINLLAFLCGYGGLFGVLFSIKYFNFCVLYMLSVSVLFSVVTWMISVVLSVLL
jgi:hypothetical protein